MPPSVVHVDLGVNRALEIRTFVDLPRNEADATVTTEENTKTLKFNPIKRVILSNDELIDIYNDDTIKEKLSDVLFRYDESEVSSLRNSQQVIPIVSQKYVMQLLMSWDEIESLRSTLNAGFVPWGEICVIAGNKTKRVISQTVKIVLIERFL